MEEHSTGRADCLKYQPQQKQLVVWALQRQQKQLVIYTMLIDLSRVFSKHLTLRKLWSFLLWIENIELSALAVDFTFSLLTFSIWTAERSLLRSRSWLAFSPVARVMKALLGSRLVLFLGDVPAVAIPDWSTRFWREALLEAKFTELPRRKSGWRRCMSHLNTYCHSIFTRSGSHVCLRQANTRCLID